MVPDRAEPARPPASGIRPGGQSGIAHSLGLRLFLWLAAFVCVILAWFAILFTGRYPRGLFEFVVGVTRWGNRVLGYAFLLVTDEYPPFRLEP